MRSEEPEGERYCAVVRTHSHPVVSPGAVELHRDELGRAAPRIAGRLLQQVRGTDSASVNPFTELTEREQEVLRLIAQGMSNAEIAATLSISEKTVKAHVSNVLSKLYLVDRTQAAVFAWREGFVKRDG